MAGALVEHMRVGDQIMSKHGAPAASRILTDDMPDDRTGLCLSGKLRAHQR